jgi:hemerythrin superfamily protein
MSIGIRIARSQPPPISGDAEKSMDAISLLKKDHREVSALFKKFESAKSEKGAIAAEVCKLITVHAQIEEELFYPAARDALEDDDEGEKLLDEAEVEHASAKELIAQIEDSEEGDDLFEAKVTVLGEYIEHHVKEEENELFPKVSKTDLDLEQLGRKLEGRKTELLADAGGEDEEGDDEAAAKPPLTKGKKGSRPPANRQ